MLEHSSSVQLWETQPPFDRSGEGGMEKSQVSVGPTAWSRRGSVIRVFYGLTRKSCQIWEEKKVLKSYPREDGGQTPSCQGCPWLWA